MKLIILALSLLSITCSTNAAGCTITLNKDLGDPQPLLLQKGYYHGNDAFHLPENRYGDVKFNANDEVVLDCPGGVLLSNGKSIGKQSATVKCVDGKKFSLNEGAGQDFKTLSCSVLPVHKAVLTGKSCLGNNKEIEINYKTADSRLLSMIIMCFDPKEQTTLYSQYNLTRYIDGLQNSYPRPDDFIEGNFYNIGNHNISNLYTRYVQRLNINRYLGLDKKSYKYIAKNGDLYLTRGHLTAKADFVYGAHQLSTFYYINVAPQWQTFNGKNWNEIEKGVRDFAADQDLDLIVYTGTHGVTTLPHEQTKKDIPLYLFDDNKGRFGIPVPQVYWKVVYEPLSKAAIAFVGVNNPYRTNAIIQKDVICKDISSNINWNISWNRTNIEEGYSYSCEVDDLRKVVKNIPAFTVSKLLQ